MKTNERTLQRERNGRDEVERIYVLMEKKFKKRKGEGEE